MGRSGPPGDPLNASGEHACGQQREGARWDQPDHDGAWPAPVLEPVLSHGPQPALVAKDVPRANSTTAPGDRKRVGRDRSLSPNSARAGRWWPSELTMHHLGCLGTVPSAGPDGHRRSPGSATGRGGAGGGEADPCGRAGSVVPLVAAWLVDRTGSGPGIRRHSFRRPREYRRAPGLGELRR
jgi:hypothetical protein